MSANGRRLKTVLWTFWKMDHSFYAKRVVWVRRKVYPGLWRVRQVFICSHSMENIMLPYNLIV